jgi:hypothetical protein
MCDALARTQIRELCAAWLCCETKHSVSTVFAEYASQCKYILYSESHVTVSADC